MSADLTPRLRKFVPVETTDRVFWLAVREALLLLVRAVERRHLPGLRKCEIDRQAQDSV